MKPFFGERDLPEGTAWISTTFAVSVAIAIHPDPYTIEIYQLTVRPRF